MFLRWTLFLASFLFLSFAVSARDVLVVEIDPSERSKTIQSLHPNKDHVLRVCAENVGCGDPILVKAPNVSVYFMVVPIINNGVIPRVEPDSLLEWPRKFFPTDNFIISVGSPLYGNLQLQEYNTREWGIYLHELETYRQSLQLEKPVWMIGVVDPRTVNGIRGIANLSSWVTLVNVNGNISSSRISEVVAHELGHAMAGSRHLPCNEKSPHSIMSPCSPKGMGVEDPLFWALWEAVSLGYPVFTRTEERGSMCVVDDTGNAKLVKADR